MKSLAYNFDNTTYIHQGTASFLQRRTLRKARKLKHEPDSSSFVRLDIKMDTLMNLISKRALAIEDLSGLDGKTKDTIKQLLLNNLLVYKA